MIIISVLVLLFFSLKLFEAFNLFTSFVNDHRIPKRRDYIAVRKCFPLQLLFSSKLSIKLLKTSKKNLDLRIDMFHVDFNAVVHVAFCTCNHLQMTM